MLVKTLIAGVALMIMLSTAPLPYSEEGTTPVAPGHAWYHTIELGSAAHVTCIVRSNSPVDMAVVRGNGTANEDVISSVNGTMLYRFTETLGPGSYRLLINNHGGSEVGIEYQVHQDFLVVANMTAKNVMAVSLALAMGLWCSCCTAAPGGHSKPYYRGLTK
jgi:hypothetical protein